MPKTWKSEATACTTCSTVYPDIDADENASLCPHCKHNDRVNDDWMFTEFVWHQVEEDAAPFILWKVTVVPVSAISWRYSSAFVKGTYTGSKQDAIALAVEDIPEGHKYQLRGSDPLDAEICTR